MITERTLLETALGILEGGDRWCRKHYHYRGKHCIVGAVYRAARRLDLACYPYSDISKDTVVYDAIVKLDNAAKYEFGKPSITVNDDIAVDFSDIERVYKRAIDECS